MAAAVSGSALSVRAELAPLELSTGNTLVDYLDKSTMVIPNQLELSVTQEFRYEDNIDETPRSSRSSSWISRTDLGGRWTRELGGFTYGLGASVSDEHYFHERKNDDSSEFEFQINPIMLGNLDFGNQHIMLGLHSTYTNEEIDNSDGRTTGVYHNGARLAWDAQLASKTGIITTADYDNEYYSKSEFRDYDNQKYSLALNPYYQYSEKTRLGLLGSVGRQEYRNDNQHDDSTIVKLGLFANYKPDDRTTLHAEGGAMRRYYPGSTVSDTSNGANRWEPFFLLTGQYQLLETVEVGANLSRDTSDSWSNSARGQRINYLSSLFVDWQLAPKTDLYQAVSFRRQDDRTSADDDDEYAYDVRLQYRPAQQWVLYMGYTVTDTKFKYNDNRDYLKNEWRIGAKLSF